MSQRRRRGPWALAVPVVMLLAGLLFAVTALASKGGHLRGSEAVGLPGLIRERTLVVERNAKDVARLRGEVDRSLAQAGDPQVAQVARDTTALAPAAGLTAVTGPGLTVTLDDAKPGRIPAGFTVDDVVVHQQDVQAVVNALWAAGAEALMIQDQRVVSTSAVRCVGNTLILQGRVYSPPYTVTAIGDAAALRRGLDADPQVSTYRGYVDTVGLGYAVADRDPITMPAYAGSLELAHARVPR